MGHTYLKGAGSARVTPQSERIPGRPEQVENSAGGYTWDVGSLERMRRFLILGSEGGTYYASEAKLTAENAGAVRAALDEHGPGAVAEIIAISEGGRAAKNDPALFALAMAFAHPDVEVRHAAYFGLPKVARTATHLFHFIDFMKSFRGWGVGAKKAVQEWYLAKAPEQLAYQLVKYRQRDGMTHRDVLRLTKPVGDASPEHNALFAWATGKANIKHALDDASDKAAGPASTYAEAGIDSDGFRIIRGYERALRAETPADTAKLVREFGLPREALNTEHLNSPEVWMAMLEQGMPITALIRNLATMTRNGVIAPMSDGAKLVIDALHDEEKLRKGRVHPIAILAAMGTYQSGRSERGSGTWTPVAPIIDALDDAYYATFGNVPNTGKRMMLALDVSPSMFGHKINGIPSLHAAHGAAVMAMATAHAESNYVITAFAGGGGRGWGAPPAIKDLPITARQRLDDVLHTMEREAHGWSRTDCSLPMRHALERGLKIDVFAVYTDNETWAGDIHPSQALTQYREKMGIDAKLVVVGLAANEFSIADPKDRGMLDVVGFDTNTPSVMAAFAEGTL